MVELLPRLHDADDAGLDLVLPVLVHLLFGLVPLGLRLALPGTRLLDLHSKKHKLSLTNIIFSGNLYNIFNDQVIIFS